MIEEVGESRWHLSCFSSSFSYRSGAIVVGTSTSIVIVTTIDVGIGIIWRIHPRWHHPWHNVVDEVCKTLLHVLWQLIIAKVDGCWPMNLFPIWFERNVLLLLFTVGEAVQHLVRNLAVINIGKLLNVLTAEYGITQTVESNRHSHLPAGGWWILQMK